MKLTKTLLSAVAIVALGLPMSAQAQMHHGGSSDVIGHLDSVSGQVIIQRAGEYLQVQNMSAVMAGDMIYAKDAGSAMVRLNGCNGKFTPCDQFVSGGNMVSVGSGDFCNNLAGLNPIGSADPVLTAGQTVVGSGGGYGSMPTIGTAPSINTLLAVLAGGGAAYGLYKLIDDDEPSSP